MLRVKLRKEFQSKFLISIRKKMGMNFSQLAKILKVYPRSLSNWSREKYTLPEEVFKKCIKLAKVEIPPYKVLPDYWNVKKAGRKGAFSRKKIYGNPGTAEGRRKGGLISQQRRRLYPELYQNCNLRKVILKPKTIPELAEFIGIVLGDGGINSDYQVIISLHKENDKHYAQYVYELIKKLFGLTPAIYRYRSLKSKNIIGITISSVALIEFLLSKGLRKGNKVKQQLDVPSWIKNNIELSRSCLRGLIDTDGGIYYHKHKSHDCQYFNVGLQFKNSSIPILEFVNKTLKLLGFTPKINKKSVNLYREKEVYRYAKEVGFSNLYHLERLKKFLRKKSKFLGGRVG